MSDAQTVTFVKHWTERLFSFRITRPAALRFRSGEFVMIGLPGDNGKPIMRAYSIASPAWADELEFYSIKVENGPLTSRLQHIEVGDEVLIRSKPVGTLVHDALTPGDRLWLFGTGTGFAPWASILRDPETYESYGRVIVTHTCRDVDELAYSRELISGLKDDPLVGELVNEQLTYVPTTTRDPSETMGRITDKILDGSLFSQVGITSIRAATDRAMVCGSVGLNTDMKNILEGFGLREGANSGPAEYVVEKAFVG